MEAQLLTNTICQGTQDPDTAKTSTIHHVHKSDASLPIIANTAVPITQHRIAHMQDPSCPPTRPQLWSPIQPFILEHELSFYPDKVFVRQLVHNLQHGCSVGYTGPQFAYLASNLSTAYQQLDVIGATLQREREAGWILRPFTQVHPCQISILLGLV